MRVVINKRHLSLNARLAKEINRLSSGFNVKNYSKIGDIDSIVSKRDISVEKKKKILIKRLHSLILTTFSIDRKKLSKEAFDSFKKRLDSIRKAIIKLRSINYYLETTFLDELGILKTAIGDRSLKLKRQNRLVRDELDALEYTAYKLIEEAAVLDKRLLKEYKRKEERMLEKEKLEVKDLGSVLGKESVLLEHLEAKLPPPNSASTALMKEPVFTNWASRVFALLSYFEHFYAKESEIFGKLKKNKMIKMRISRKIAYLAKEKSRLLKIMEEKAASMKRFKTDAELKKELHNLITTINL